jgi:hypothetical protein
MAKDRSGGLWPETHFYEKRRYEKILQDLQQTALQLTNKGYFYKNLMPQKLKIVV